MGRVCSMLVFWIQRHQYAQGRCPPAYLYVPANVSTERCDNADGPFFAFHVTGLGAKFPLIKTCARRLLPQEQADRDAIKNRLLENIVVNPMNFEDSWEWSKHVRPCA